MTTMRAGEGAALFIYFPHAFESVRTGVSIERNSSSGWSLIVFSSVAQGAASVTGRNTPFASALELDRGDRPVGAVCDLDLADLADGHARDPDVRLRGERRRLGEVDLHAIALRLQRHGPAEGQPEEQQQPEAGQREDDHHEDPGK